MMGGCIYIDLVVDLSSVIREKNNKDENINNVLYNIHLNLNSWYGFLKLVMSRKFAAS